MDETLLVVRETEDGLYQEKWVFHQSEYTILLQRYQKSVRNLDQWKVTHMYDSAGGGYGNWTWLKEAQVPWGDGLKTEAAEAILQRIRVVRPSDLKKRHK